MSFLQYKLSTIDKFRIYKIPFRKKYIAAQQANRCSKFRSSHQKCPLRKGVPRNFTKFTGKHLCQSQACNFVKKETLAQVFSCEFCEISRNTFFTEHLWATASQNWIYRQQNHFTTANLWSKPNIDTLAECPWVLFCCLYCWFRTNIGQ